MKRKFEKSSTNISFFNPKTKRRKTTPSLHQNLFFAIHSCDLPSISAAYDLFQNKWDIQNHSSYSGNTAFHLAVDTDNPEVTRFFLGRVSFSALNRNDENAVQYAARINKAEALKVILEYLGSRYVYESIDKKNRTLLHVAILGKAYRTFDYLLEKYGHEKKFLNQYDYCKNTALHMAVLRNDFYMAKKLIQAGINLSIANYEDKTAEQLATISCPSLLPLFQKSLTLSKSKIVNLVQNNSRSANNTKIKTRNVDEFLKEIFAEVHNEQQKNVLTNNFM